MKFTKKDILNVSALLLIYIFIILFLKEKGLIYGSNVDWINQHYLFADYFRNLFYDTHEVISSFSMHLGAGQNIFNFAYYGYLSPVILVSFLFPFISMEIFLGLIMTLLILLSIIFMYKWLRNNDYNENISFLTTFVFLSSSPIIFHTHRHIMFVSYIPALIIGFILIDKYFKTNKKYLLSIVVAYIIMSSYFYSISSLISLALYATYKYLKLNKFKFKEFKNIVIDLLKPVILGIAAGAVILLPVFSIILKGRIGVKSSYGLFELLPSARIDVFLYNAYSLGFTAFFIIVLSCMFFNKKRENKFLLFSTLLLLFFPVIVYLLNGALYINGKVLIPFIPLICILYAEFFKDFLSNKIRTKKFLIPFILIIAFIFLTETYEQEQYFYIGFCIDLIITTILFLIANKYNKYIFIIPIFCLMLCFTLFFNKTDEFVLKSRFLYDYSYEKEFLINETIKKDKTFYRFANTTDNHDTVNKIYNKNYYTAAIYSSTYNNYYNRFFFKEFDNENPYRNTGLQYSTKNIMYDILMGNKYKLSTFKDSSLLEEVETNKNYSIYKNNYVYSIGYATDKNMNINDYEKLDYPYNTEALLVSSISKDKTNFDYNTKIEKLNWNFDTFNIKNENGVVKFKNKKEEIKRLYLPETIKNKALIISFEMKKEESCEVGDTYIKIDGVKNKLTCSGWKYKNDNHTFNYVLSSKNEINSLKLTISKGSFEIEDINFYTIDFDYLKSLNNNIDRLNVKREDINQDGFTGSINVKKDSKFILTIPYDENFIIKVDGKKQKIEKVNKSFIGFNIKKGYHNVEVTYFNKSLFIGKIITIISYLLIIIFLIREKVKKSKN